MHMLKGSKLEFSGVFFIIVMNYFYIPIFISTHILIILLKIIFIVSLS